MTTPVSGQPEQGRGRPRQPELGAAILGAALELWGQVGYERLSMEAVAERAGVAKTTVYRRWPSKLALVTEAALMVGEREVPEPDTGSTRSDLVALVRSIGRTYSRTVAGPILGDLVGEMSRNPALAEAFAPFWEGRRAVMRRVLARGVERGDLRADLDDDHAIELLTGPVYYRFLVSRRPLSPTFAARIVDTALSGLAPR
jgi:AcrR family transcriptional regulator